MRIAIDLQPAQSGDHTNSTVASVLGFATAIARARGRHEVMIALNGAYPSTIEPIRAVFDGILPQACIRVSGYLDTQVSEPSAKASLRGIADVCRTAFLASLEPDVIHLDAALDGLSRGGEFIPEHSARRTLSSVRIHDGFGVAGFGRMGDAVSGERIATSLFPTTLREVSVLIAPNVADDLWTADLRSDCLRVECPALAEPILALAGPTWCREPNDYCEGLGISKPFLLGICAGPFNRSAEILSAAYARLPNDFRRHHQLVLLESSLSAHSGSGATVGALGRSKEGSTVYIENASNQDLCCLVSMSRLCLLPSAAVDPGMSLLNAIACHPSRFVTHHLEASGRPQCQDLGMPPPGEETEANSPLLGLAGISAISEWSVRSARAPFAGDWDRCAADALLAWEEAVERAHRTKAPKRDARPRLAYVSPMPPAPTGIADYSADLLPALSQYYDIAVVVAEERLVDPWIHANWPVRDASWLRANAHRYDRVVYHLGNSNHHAYMLGLTQDIPGVVVLHDFFLGHLLSAAETQTPESHSWSNALLESHGAAAACDRTLNPGLAVMKYPGNWPFIANADGILVHSTYAQRIAKHWYGDAFAERCEVLPLVRSEPRLSDRARARENLGYAPDEFLVASFGFLGPTKLNHRLIDAWTASRLGVRTNCRLIFVGALPAGEYQVRLEGMIRESGRRESVRITGFLDHEEYEMYLSAVDLAVQLRSDSRGETSAAVMDCLNYGIPIIVNGNGALAELDPEAALILPDDFEIGDLVTALETLTACPTSRKRMADCGRSIVATGHRPSVCANRYADAIERFSDKAFSGMPSLIRAIRAQGLPDRSSEYVESLATQLARSFPPRAARPGLYLDVTATNMHDLKTGIERVVRSLCFSLLSAPPPEFRVYPVYLSNRGGSWHYRHASGFSLRTLGCIDAGPPCTAAELVPGDVVLTMDLSGGALTEAGRAGFYEGLRAHGVSVYAIVYDLLPVTLPGSFPPGSDRQHSAWLEVVSTFDGAYCISESVATDLSNWHARFAGAFKPRRSFEISWFPLGADVSGSVPTKGGAPEALEFLSHGGARARFLMVGTIEPRKGHRQVVDAFTLLWKDNVDIELVLLGSEGWTSLPSQERRDIPDTVAAIRGHPEFGNRLFWFSNVTDEMLEAGYAASDCLIAASYGEGFGLPLIEASRHGVPIIARDIPVFREVAGSCAFFFPDGRAPAVISDAVLAWLEARVRLEIPDSSGIAWASWSDSAAALLQLLKSKAGY